MSNYLELKMPVSWNAELFAQLCQRMAEENISVRWQAQYHHITVVFINNDELVEELTKVFNVMLTRRKAPHQTLDILDAFEAKYGTTIIVAHTATHPSIEFIILVDQLCEMEWEHGADIDVNFLQHVTLVRIKSTDVQAVKRIVTGIEVPPFTLQLKET